MDDARDNLVRILTLTDANNTVVTRNPISVWTWTHGETPWAYAMMLSGVG